MVKVHIIWQMEIKQKGIGIKIDYKEKQLLK
jgi:hypothetical protein